MNDENPTGANDKSENGIGSPSDYILIAMIVAMMLCMTICCICLFCRTTSRNISVCGYTCEVNNSRNPSVGIDDVSELHEVVPLTPAVANAPNIPDIENKLKSDPPPPQYTEVVSTNVFDRFRWRSKRKRTNTDDSGGSRKTSESISRIKSKQSEKKKRPSRAFSRKATAKSFKESQSTDLPATPEVVEVQDNSKQNIKECVIAMPDSSKNQNVSILPNENSIKVEKIENNVSAKSEVVDDEVFI